MFVLGSTVLSPDRAFTHPESGVQYPSNWLKLSTAAEREAIGIRELPDPPQWDQRFFWGYDDDGQLIPKDHAQLMEQWTATTRTTAGTLLAPTDWLITREADTGAPCPPEIRAWRQDVRDAAAAKVAVIEATADTPRLAEYLTAVDYSTWPEMPEIQSSAAGPDYRAFYDALLVSPAYAAIRAKAVDNAAVLTACVEFIAAIGDAKSGRPNPAAIQACVDLLCAAAQFTAEELQALADVMQVGGLDQVYVLPEA
jgi:hypothetical protein